jgi:hypothetical protein
MERVLHLDSRISRTSACLNYTIPRLTPGVFICVLYEYTLMSIHNDFVVHICEMTGDSSLVVDQELRPAHLTLAMANAHGFESIDDYEEAIREYVYG